MSLDIAFITINYNSSNHTIELIKSIQKYTNPTTKYKIIVVDNASTNKDLSNLEDFCTNLQNVKLIKNNINSGFASGNMLGVKNVDAQYYFFINNDTQLLNDVATIMKKYLDAHPDISLSTARVNDENNNFSSSYKLFPSLTKELLGNSVARKFTKHNFPSNKIKLKVPSLVEVVSGSCMFFRASTFDEIGGFDETFFLYCEEEDISKRVWDAGKKVTFIPDAEIYHMCGGSTGKSLAIKKEFYISYKHLIFKHFNLFSAYIMMFLQLFKLFRRSFKTKDGYKLFLFGLRGFDKKESLRYKQKQINSF